MPIELAPIADLDISTVSHDDEYLLQTAGGALAVARYSADEGWVDVDTDDVVDDAVAFAGPIVPYAVAEDASADEATEEPEEA